MSKKQFSIRLDMEVYEQLDNYRWANKKTLNDVINEAVKRFLDEKDMESNQNPSSTKSSLRERQNGGEQDAGK